MGWVITGVRLACAVLCAYDLFATWGTLLSAYWYLPDLLEIVTSDTYIPLTVVGILKWYDHQTFTDRQRLSFHTPNL